MTNEGPEGSTIGWRPDEVAAPANAAAPAVATLVDGAGPAARALTILVAEDNPINQEVALGILESLGNDVLIVENGAEALRAYQEAADDRFDMILMDCQMPVMDGLEAARRIRGWEKAERRIPILALTANALDGSRAACLEAGMDDVLSKPFRSDALKALLDRWASDDGPIAAPRPETPPSVLDPTMLQSLRELDPDGSKGFLSRTITKFASYGDDVIANMARCVLVGDLAELSRLAHSLKSSSANLGATSLASQCQKIEALTQDNVTTIEISNYVEKLVDAYQHARRELLSML